MKREVLRGFGPQVCDESRPREMLASSHPHHPPIGNCDPRQVFSFSDTTTNVTSIRVYRSQAEAFQERQERLQVGLSLESGRLQKLYRQTLTHTKL